MVRPLKRFCARSKKRIKDHIQDSILYYLGAIAAIMHAVYQLTVPEHHITTSGLVGAATIMIFSGLPFMIIALQETRPFQWDRQVILHDIVNVPSIIIHSVAIACVVLLWDISTQANWTVSGSSASLQSLSFGVFILAMSEYVVIFWKTYAWLTKLGRKDSPLTYQAERRVEYLKGDMSDQNKARIWDATTWKEFRNRPVSEQEALFDAFIKQMDGIQNKSIKANIIHDLSPQIHNLTLSSDSIYTNLMRLAFPTNLAEDQKRHWRLDGNREELQTQLVEISLVIKSQSFYYPLNHLFFYKCQETITALQDVSTGRRSKGDLQFMQRISELIFQVHARHGYDNIAWQGFPEEWRVTVDNLQGKNSRPYAQIWLQTYMNWMVNKSGLQNFAKGPSEKHFNAVKMTGTLIPEVHPGLWANLLHLAGFHFHKEKEHIRAEIRYFASRWEPPLYIWGLKAGLLDEEDSGEKVFKKQLREAEVRTIEIFKQTGILPPSVDAHTIDKYIAAARELVKSKDIGPGKRALDTLIAILKTLKNYL